MGTAAVRKLNDVCSNAAEKRPLGFYSFKIGFNKVFLNRCYIIISPRRSTDLLLVERRSRARQSSDSRLWRSSLLPCLLTTVFLCPEKQPASLQRGDGLVCRSHLALPKNLIQISS